MERCNRSFRTHGLARHRQGLSLLEVVVSAVILAGSLAILGQLVQNGRLAISRSVNEIEALSRCQSVMDAAVVEISTGTPVPDMLLDDGEWLSEVIIDETESESLVRVTVLTRRVNERGTRTANIDLARLVYLPPEDDSLSEGLL